MYASRFNFLSSEDHFSETGNYGLAKSKFFSPLLVFH